METIFAKTAKHSENVLYLLFRIFVGLMFAFHGMQKLGWMSTGKGFMTPAMFAGFMGLPVWLGYVVALTELLVGLAVILGLFTRLASIGGVVVMIVALIMAHFPSGWNPVLNGGETALLYLSAFFILFIVGSGKWSLEKVMCKKECF